MNTKKNQVLFLLGLLPLIGTAAYAQTDITDIAGTQSAQYNDSPANETLIKLFDNSSATKYLTFHNAAWVQYQVAQPYIVTKYALTSANDFAERDPKNWTLQGSNNGTTWTTINTQSNQTFTARFQRKEYTFTNTTAYTYYRLNMTASSGTTLQAAELEIYGTLPVVDITNLAGIVTGQYDYTQSGSGEGVEKVVDNSAATKYLTFHDQAWIQWQAGNSSVVTKYSITSANDAETRDPKNWTLQGSNNGTTWTTIDTRMNEDFPSRLQRREFTIPNTTAYTYYRLNMTNNSDGILQLGEWELFGTGGGGTIIPPATWQEHWFDHTQLLTRKYYDDDVVVYYDNDVDPTVTWPFQFTGDVWRYTKSLYGSFGQDKRLYVICHTNKYSGGHPSTYFDASHDYRNVIDCGPGPWTTFDYNALAIPTHEVGHIVELGSKGAHNSPAFGLWGDSKWMEIYIYDVYKGLGRTADANTWYNEQINKTDSFPRANTRWFRDWFYPIYNQYGGAPTLNKYFTLLGQNFPRSSNGVDYSRAMNWGEFVHFWSGAAGVNLKAQATTAFGWPAQYETQFQQAKIDFPNVTYTG
ncbi:discoidin domain-containing protein [bacterium]|nr:MAG: discoidin domain-containing protein [bacterium]